MAGEEMDHIPESGAVFTFGKSKFADNVPSKFWLKNDAPRKIACGDEHTALLTENGKLFMFGSNNWGQLGLGSKMTVKKPTCVRALKSEKIQLVACGRNHTLICTAQGHVYATGGNSEGQLGLGDCDERTSFQRLKFFDSCGPIKMLAAGSNTSAALTESGELFMWGDNSEGQVGLGKESHACSPQEVSAGQPIAWVSCGYYHSAYVTADGALYTFGERDSGKLGLGTDQLARHRFPQIVKSMPEPVTQVACGGGHTVAITENGVYAFGLGQFGQLGHGTFIFESRLPRQIEHFKKGRVCQVACGENHSAVITERGLLYTFGDGRHGKLGLGEENFTNQFKPTLCPRFIKCQVQEAVCGGCHMVVLARPRDASCGAVLLEDNDVTEDYLEKPYVELLGDLGDTSNPARVRRREREHLPEQFGTMSGTSPTATSSYLQPPAPVSCHTTVPNLPSSELAHRKVLHSAHRHGNKEPSAGQGDDVVESLSDTDSVKGLGETTDFLNMTHVMKMDPGDKILTLSPLHKKKGKHGKTLTSQKEKPLKESKLSERPGFSSTSLSHKREVGAARKAAPTKLTRSSSARFQKTTEQNKENRIVASKQGSADFKKAAGRRQLRPSASTIQQDKPEREQKAISKQYKGKPTRVTKQFSDFSLSDACELSPQQQPEEKAKPKQTCSKDAKTSKNERNRKEAESKNAEDMSSLHLVAGAAALLQEVAAFTLPSPSESSHHVTSDRATLSDSNRSASSVSSSPSSKRGRQSLQESVKQDTDDVDQDGQTGVEEEERVSKVTSASEQEVTASQNSEKVTEQDESDTLKSEDKSGTDEEEESESVEEGEEEEEAKTQPLGKETEDKEKESKDLSVEEESEEGEEESGHESEGEEKEEHRSEEEEEAEEEESASSKESDNDMCEEEEEGESSEEGESGNESAEGEEEKTEEEEEEEEEEENEEENRSEEEEDDEEENRSEEEEDDEEEESEEEEEKGSEEEESGEEEEESEDEEEQESEDEEEEESEDEEETADEGNTEEEEQESEEEEEEKEEEVKKKRAKAQRRPRSGFKGNAAGESEEFWDDVLPQYLNLR